MKKAPLYSRSRPPARTETSPASAAAAPAADPAATPPARTRRTRFGAAMARHERRLWAGAVLALVAGGVAFNASLAPRTPALTMQQIDTAMRKSIEDKPLASPVAAAYDAVLPSVVRVVGLLTEGDDGSDRDDQKSESAAPGDKLDKITKGGKERTPVERGIGTGVVIIDNGTILTNLHVINGARRIKVTFMDGTESDAVVLSTQPENDLAVLRAKTIPDDLEAATLRSTADLAPGDQVMAVGFPFGIGPSASAGVVSGLKREFRSPEGKQTMTNLIQFDAAANPGNSGGPLVTMDGEVVGIVTAILNPSHQRTFIGIGFAVPIENAAAAVGMPPF
ncbi:MAG TPA: trypsin-like peptidase domain-containing protein [Burkholderiaceae bacterium]|nr:trypsin-like peptidase domain-containing protein [Burkholderiaceae bacterium]